MDRLLIRGGAVYRGRRFETADVLCEDGKIAAIGEELAAQDAQVSVLSMGMSQDADIALEEGSTLVRLGTSLFGRREGYDNTAREGK